ncbi:adenosylcobinamide-GDP ribazoletransferase [Sagittula marina]|uniref:Adenosylcobinamide-GDP ribazoletransferase n=1 Tax=Sagittula marina TaxID=943940 RepID=A0A7W6DMJ7_9RHOB|nr:adenosylcobinamide-GDP ribazoletransferase [Sagittula marina]MBB3985507.1 adenosylcobinamide-GDP ribazoletransferase [Sagittula marina]
MKRATTQRLSLQADLFRRALASTTGLPAARGLLPSDDLDIRSRQFWPVTQALCGLMAALVLWGAGLFLAQIVAAVLALIALILLGDGGNWQGLAATMDGLTSGRRTQDVLRRMRLPGLDACGGMTLALGLGLSAAIVATLPSSAAGGALIAGAALGGMARVHVKATTWKVGTEGMQARLFTITEDGYRVALLSTLLVLLGLWLTIGFGAAAMAFLGAVTSGQTLRWRLVARLGGFTREGLGAIQIAAQLGAYLGLALAV